MTQPMDRRSQHDANRRADRQWKREAQAILEVAQDGRKTGDVVIRLMLVDGIIKKFVVSPALEQYVHAE